MSWTTTEVLVIARREDPHASAVVDLLRKQKKSAHSFSLHELRQARVVWRPNGFLEIEGSEGSFRVSTETTIWLRRTGWMEVGDLDAAEAQLIAAEGWPLLKGMLASTGARWVDPVEVVERAENKLFQLSTALRLGIDIPPTIVTNILTAAQDLTARGAVVAKPVSGGPGLAPVTSLISSDLLPLVQNAPTLLQKAVLPKTDLRVVTVGERVFVWRRKAAADEPIDWREADPSGACFRRVRRSAKVARAALRIAQGLHLTVSVQDWVQCGRKLFFLETNPQGQWLFLEGAQDEVVQAFAEHLCSQDSTSSGCWPSPFKQFLWDLGPARLAPKNAGIVAPVFQLPTSYPSDAEALEHARRSHDQAEARALAAEEKGSRLLNLCLALLASALALTSYQLSLTVELGWRVFALSSTLLTILFFSLAGIRAFEVDSVGAYNQKGVTAIPDNEPETSRSLVALEELGRATAAWTADRKHSDLMQARAWFTRGLASLFAAAMITLVLLALPSP